MSEKIQPGTLYVVSTPIGNLDDITYRAIKILSSVDVIAAEDTRTSKILLNHYNISKPMLSYHSYNEQRRTPELISRLLEGQSVALITDAGTPGISDPAFVILKSAVENSIPIIPIPGASSVLAALVVSGLPFDRFVFEGFLPQKKGRKSKLESLKEETRTIVLFESPHRILKLLDEIQLCLGDRTIAVVRELTKKFEEVKRGKVSHIREELSKKESRGEYVVVIEGRKK
jgi:16S rRNA (cytidine1402-2'-O)-methyltransferase